MSSIDQIVVLHYDFILKAVSPFEDTEFTPFDSKLYLDLLKTAFDNKSYIKRQKGNLRFEIADIHEDDNHICILLNKHDKQTPNRSFKDYDKQAYKNYNKSMNEFENYSVHVTINKTPLDANRFTGLIEHQRGFSTTDLIKSVNLLLKNCAKARTDKILFKDIHPTVLDKKGQNKKVDKYPTITLLPYTDDSLNDAIKAGKITELDLIQEDDNDIILDEENYFSAKKTVATLKVEKRKLPLTDQLKDVIKKNKDKYSHVRIHYKTEDGITCNPTYDIDSFNIVNEVALIKKTVFDRFENKLSSGYSEINKEIFDRMKNHI